MSGPRYFCPICNDTLAERVVEEAGIKITIGIPCTKPECEAVYVSRGAPTPREVERIRDENREMLRQRREQRNRDGGA